MTVRRPSCMHGVSDRVTPFVHTNTVRSACVYPYLSIVADQISVVFLARWTREIVPDQRTALKNRTAYTEWQCTYIYIGIRQ